MEILDTIEVWHLQMWVPIVIMVSLVVGAITYKLWLDEDDGWFLISSIACFGAFIILFVLACMGRFSYFDYDKTVVRVNENVTVSELYEKYEILSKEEYSNVFYVKEKTNKK